MKPHVTHTPDGWTVTFISSETGRVTTTEPWDLDVAQRRALHIALRQGRGL